MRKKWVALIVVLSVLPAHVMGAVDNGFVPWRECLRQRPQWYGGPEARRIADNLLLYQRASGGWPKNTEMAAVLTDSQGRNRRGQGPDRFDHGQFRDLPADAILGKGA